MKFSKITLIFLLSFYLIITYIAISKDKSPWSPDCPFYYQISLKYFNELSQPSFKTPLNLYRIDRVRHSIFMYFSLPFYFIFGTQQHVALYSNLIFLIILILSIYSIGKYLKDEKTGLLSAAVIMLFPAISFYARIYMLDFALTAIVSLSIYFLLRTDQFRNSIYSILFGISFAIGMLIKIPYIVFISMPFIYIVYTSLTQNNRTVRMISKNNIIGSTILGISIPFIWYLPRIDTVIRRIRWGAIDAAFLYKHPYGKDLLTYLYIHKLTSLSFIIVFAFSLYYYIRIQTKNKTLLLSWIGFPLIFFTLVPNKHIRHIIPVLPAISVIISIGVQSIRVSWIKQIIIPLILLIGFLQYYVLTYTPLSNFATKFFLFGRPLHQPVDTRNWHVMDIIETIKRSCDLTKKDKEIKISVLSMHDYVWNLQSVSYMLKLPFSITSCGYSSCEYSQLKSLDVDFVLVQDGGYLALPFGNFLDKINLCRKFFESNINKFNLIGIFILPDGAKVSIYKKQ